MIPSVEQLVDHISETASDDLKRIESASEVARELEAVGDELVNHFVSRARAAGKSWSEIGQGLSVTRQAAHKRFGAAIGDGLLTELYTDRTLQWLDYCHVEAMRLRHRDVGTEHLLLAFYDVPECFAVHVLEALEVDRSDIERAIAERVRPDRAKPAGRPPFNPRARKVLEEGAKAALDLGHHYIGTEHILLGLLRYGEGVANAVLAELGVTYDAATAAIIGELAGRTQ